MRHRIEEIERLAMTGCGLPEGYSQPEQLLFLSLRILHWEFRNRIIGREQARREKKLLVDDFRQEQRFHEIYQENIRIRNTMSHRLTAAEKSGCPHCRERLKRYEAEKQKLIELGISPLAYERAMIELARKWRV